MYGKKLFKVILFALLVMLMASACGSLNNDAGLVQILATNTPTPTSTVNPDFNNQAATEEPDNDAGLLENLSNLLNVVTDPNPTIVVLGDAKMNWSEFEEISRGYTNGSEDAGPFVDKLDTHLVDVKVDHPEGGWTLTSGANQACVFWTGLYIDELGSNLDTTFGGKVARYVVDGNSREGMGVWLLLPNNSIEVPTPAGSICMDGFNGNVAPQAGPRYFDAIDANAQSLGQGGGAITISASSCLPNNVVVPMLAALGNTDATFVAFDTIANQNPNARLRSGSDAVVAVKAYRSFVWTRTGNAQGPVIAIAVTNDGKSMYLATEDGEVSMTHSFSGLEVCDQVTESQLPGSGNVPHSY